MNQFPVRMDKHTQLFNDSVRVKMVIRFQNSDCFQAILSFDVDD